MTIEANYEIIRFIEHGNKCRPAMDCVPGELLIYRVRQCAVLEKETLFEWMGELLHQLEQYQRCRNNQGYRYLNPYSVLVTREDKLLLLDLEAETNEFVLRNLQKRAMRNHFVKPVVHIKENAKITLDLYGYGKTMQFILANTEIQPSLSKWEENRIARLIDRCLGENSKKAYGNFEQVQRDLPAIRKKSGFKDGKQRKWAILCGTAVCMLALAGTGFYKEYTKNQQMSEVMYRQRQELEEIRKERDEQTEQMEKAAQSEEKDRMKLLEKYLPVFQEYLIRNTEEDSKEILRVGNIVSGEILRCMGEVYQRENQQEKALEIYEYLCKTEKDKGKQTEYLQLKEKCSLKISESTLPESGGQTGEDGQSDESVQKNANAQGNENTQKDVTTQDGESVQKDANAQESESSQNLPVSK